MWIGESLVHWFFFEREGISFWQELLAPSGHEAYMRVLLIGLSAAAATLVVWILLRLRAEIRTSRRLADEKDQLLEHAGEGIYGVDREGNVSLVNAAAARILGYTPEELRGMPQHETMHHTRADGSPYPREDCPVHMTMADGQGRRVDGEVFWRRDGTSFPVLYVTTPIPEGGAVVSFFDQTQLKEAEAEADKARVRFEALFQQIPDAVLLVDADSGTLVEWNAAAAKVSGRAREDVAGVDIRDAVAHMVNLENRPVVDAIFRIGEGSFEARRQGEDGEFHDLFATVRRVQERDANRLLLVVRDVTDLKRAERDNRRLALAVNQAGDSVIMTDIDGAIEFVNPNFERLSGYSRQEAVGATPRIVKSGVHPPDFYRELWGTLTRGDTWTGRFVNRAKDGELWHQDTVISSFRDPDGTITGFVSVGRDVTDRVSWEQRRRQEDKVRTVGRLTGGIAHDFNNILAVLQVNTEMVTASAKDGSGILPEDLDELKGAVDRGRTLVKKLLALSRPQDLVRRSVRLQSVAAELLPTISRLLPDNVIVSGTFPDELPLVLADAGSVDQILMNLATNARDAMPGGGRLEITLSAETISTADADRLPGARPGNWVRCSVRDSGIGMDAETLEKIFEPFFSTKPVGKGTGLGASVVHGLVQAHEGFVNVESALGQGTTFNVFFPALAHDAQEDAKKAPRHVGGSEGTETILFADDEAALRRAGRRSLARLGYTVLEAEDGRVALSILRERRREIDLVVTDVMMPHMGGRELFDTARAEGLAVPFLFISGYQKEDLWERLDDVPVLSKPWGLDELAAAVRGSLDAARADGGQAQRD